MTTHILINTTEEYGGQYVATKSFKDRDVIAHGKDPIRVTSDAKKGGIKDPVVFYVPKGDVVQIY